MGEQTAFYLRGKATAALAEKYWAVTEQSSPIIPSITITAPIRKIYP